MALRQQGKFEQAAPLFGKAADAYTVAGNAEYSAVSYINQARCLIALKQWDSGLVRFRANQSSIAVRS